MSYRQTVDNGIVTHKAHTYPFALTEAVMTSIALVNVSTPNSLSRVTHVMTYIGGAINLITTGASRTPVASPSARPSLIASIPSYVKQVTSISARILTGWGASLLCSQKSEKRHERTVGGRIVYSSFKCQTLTYDNNSNFV